MHGVRVEAPGFAGVSPHCAPTPGTELGLIGMRVRRFQLLVARIAGLVPHLFDEREALQRPQRHRRDYYRKLREYRPCPEWHELRLTTRWDLPGCDCVSTPSPGRTAQGRLTCLFVKAEAPSPAGSVSTSVAVSPSCESRFPSVATRPAPQRI